mmetsp:Transcript_9611/g.18048  ORF Transcript_9611/g.18048 Transcript_9611/m.18048 type:complete len:2241 (-) Transcript_9611:332-7054(-)
MEDSANNSLPGLPFLVVHWLNKFGGAPRNADSHRISQEEGEANNQESKQDALDRIRRATIDLADAFADLGAFGVALHSPLGESIDIRQDEDGKPSLAFRNAKYTDVARRWDSVSKTQLELLVASSTSATCAVLHEFSQHSKPSLLDLAKHRSKNSLPIAAQESNVSDDLVLDQTSVVPSILLRPILLQKANDVAEKEDKTRIETSDNDRNLMTPILKANVAVGSDFRRVQELVCQASKRYLDIRHKFLEEEMTLRQIRRSLGYQRRMKLQIERDITNLLTSDSAGIGPGNDFFSDRRRSKSDELSQKKLENDRVLAQLGRNLEDLEARHQTGTAEELRMAERVFKSLWNESVSMEKSYMDPNRIGTSGYHSSSRLHGRKVDTIVNCVVGRSYGVGVKRLKGSLRQRIGCIVPEYEISQRTKKLFSSRLSHVVTINAHLFCPVYCLRFDRTGRYFVTGADDNLVKLFQIGTSAQPDSKELRRYHSVNPDCSCHRGAVLVCTLRGHAGVITDIDVSIDNALLATASGDGDVRVWGMYDGCPVAILRGHEGGANMVSWSHISPYQLVSVSDDGLARIWDVRQAALKRCKSTRIRKDYITWEKNIDCVGAAIQRDSYDENPGHSTLEGNIGDRQTQQAEDNTNEGVYVPPLPAGAEFGVGAEINNLNENDNDSIIPGSFIANDEIDEGATLISRLQHGEILDNPSIQGPGTRSRRKKVKVICLSRCPNGGHFATGSDDGIGRIWLDDTNDAIEKLDRELDYCDTLHTECIQGQATESLQRTRSSFRGYNNAPSTSSLLASLHGHHNEITDIKYSNNGDRLITASQKDGVVRVWSWGSESLKASDGNIKIEQIRQIFIRMEPPPYLIQNKSSNTANMPANRRRGGASSSQRSNILTRCDVAIWTTDDSRVITSQSSVFKTSDIDIIPGSHILYIWDSITGDCLIGVPGSHEKPCPVLLSHPLDSSILVSAGADGRAIVWDMDAGRCIFSYQNVHSFGALDNLADRGKFCGYLDGNFSPDGLTIVLTDDTGRLTMIDVLGYKSNSTSSKENQNVEDTAPSWMQEQYFANDYYDLFYDRNGYCVERGSGLPPHLAPEAARCMHTGHPYPESIQMAFAAVKGPLPLPEQMVQTYRHRIRQKSSSVRKLNGLLVQNVTGKRHLIEARANPSINLYEKYLSNYDSTVRDESVITQSPRRPSTATAGRNMSTNYRWLDFDEAERDEDDDDQESDDEEYEEGNGLAFDDEQEIDYVESDDNEPRVHRYSERNRGSLRRENIGRRGRNGRRREIHRDRSHQNEPTRSSSRQILRRRDPLYVDLSDESDFEELLSSNTSPSGEYAKDYTEYGHLYKLPPGTSIQREWATRVDSVLGYTGWKTYCPQVGDRVVYIPKAHAEILKVYPICESVAGAPWKSWPKSAPWPIVVCEVKAVRYRFPYNGYLGTRSRNPIVSVIAILTLELLRVPSSRQSHDAPWIQADFVPRPSTRSMRSTFEVSLFENSEADFVLPLELFKWRADSLQRAIEQQGTSPGVGLIDFFASSEVEDSIFEPYSCELSTVMSNDERELHFQGSGYNALQLKYEGSNVSIASVWDVTVSGTEDQCPLPPCLTDEQTSTLTDILTSLECDEYVKTVFSVSVDTRRFTDYEEMVEVPIDISFIKGRLQHKYYTNVYSVLADMKLLRDNCMKYNKEGSEITTQAEQMFQCFQLLFEEKLGMIGYEAGERTRSTEFETALRSINRQRRSSRREASRRRDNISGSDNRGVQNSRSSSNRSQRFRLRSNVPNTRSSQYSQTLSPVTTTPRVQNAQRIRVNLRRLRQEEHSSREPTAEQINLDEVIDHSATNITLVIAGKSYKYPYDDISGDIDVQSLADDGSEMQSSRSNIRRQSSRLRKKIMIDKTFDDEFSDELHEYESDSEHQAKVKFRSNSSSEEEYNNGRQDFGSDSDDHEGNSSTHHGRVTRYNRKDIRSSDIKDTLTASAAKRHTRSSSRSDPTQVESLRETFQRRRSTSESQPAEYSPNANRRPSRSSTRTSSALENLPQPSLLTSSPKRPSRRRNQNGVSYQEYSCSDVEDGDDDSHGKDFIEIDNSDVTGKKRPRKIAVKNESPKKKAKITNQVEDVELPHIEKWPGHIIKPHLLKDVCIAIINRIQVFDAEGLFNIPVIEQYPEVAKSYLEKVNDPMDLRTIITDRVPHYRVISELQDDLILMLQNCCTFNRVKSEYWKYAVEIWNNLNEIFIETLKDMGLDLPRRFGR